MHKGVTMTLVKVEGAAPFAELLNTTGGIQSTMGVTATLNVAKMAYQVQCKTVEFPEYKPYIGELADLVKDDMRYSQLNANGVAGLLITDNAGCAKIFFNKKNPDAGYYKAYITAFKPADK